MVAELEDPAPVALRVVAPRVTPRFVQGLRALGCELTTTEAGTHAGRLGVFPLRVIETVPVALLPPSSAMVYVKLSLPWKPVSGV